jgi:hypothetical protein
MMLKAKPWGAWFEGLCIVLALVGIGLRFSRLDWNQGTNLHPDEYGLTNTLTQLRLPGSLDNYFNTRISSISPYMRYDIAGNRISDGPDNRMRWGQWPIILLRAFAEWTGNTGYDELRVTGRYLSAFVDSLGILLLFLIGESLYNRRVGLLAAALSSLAVLQIQQAHFMTVDTFAVLFSLLAMLAAVRIAQHPLVIRSEAGSYRPMLGLVGWFALFGAAFGMAVSSKVNLAPLAGMVCVAAVISIADLRLRAREDLKRILLTAAVFLLLSGAVALLTFRLTQPMSFRAAQGDTNLFTLQLNPDWLESMQVAQGESSGVGGGPPGEQWTARMPLIFPLVNLVVWGMGVALGLAAWLGFAAALWQWLRFGSGWRVHLLPLVWTGGYFLFMGTRWVMSMRYFLPIYPFLCLLAAWGLLSLWQRSRNGSGRWGLAGGVVVGGVLFGTMAWAFAFTNAVYWTDHTRLQATRWIFQNIPAPFHLTLQTTDGREVFVPVGAPDGLVLDEYHAFSQTFQVAETGTLTAVTIPHAAAVGGIGRLYLAVQQPGGNSELLGEAELTIRAAMGDQPGEAARATMHSQVLKKGQSYQLRVNVPAGQPGVRVTRTVLSNESWDEGLPVPFEGYDPFGQFYRGLTMQVRWFDDANKRQMFLDTLAQTDYIIVPSQRSVWATCRLPHMYPMTMAYYQALFSGKLGFAQVANFSAPLRLGPLYISDLAGSAAWGKSPDLPIFNHNLLAAEEAFSVYDHPPVWIFKKQSEFNLLAVQRVLDSVDLSQVQAQSPRDATGVPCP